MLWPELLASTPALLAAKAYDAQERGRDLLQNAGGQAVIPPKQNRKDQRAYEEARSKARPLLANFFAKLKQLRGMATRYDKRATTFLGAVYLAAAVIWLN